jgi:hypothetical protein
MSFDASHDSLSKGVTGSVLVLLFTIAVATHSLTAVGFSALGLVAAFLWSPLGYEISDGFLVVKRPIGRVCIALDRIRDVRPASIDDMSGCIRLFGSGGLFGYFGLYSTSRLGRNWWYVTNRDHRVVVTGDSITAVVSPDEVDGFVAAVRKAAAIKPANQSASAMFELVGNAGGGQRWLAALVAVPVLAVVAAALLYAPGPPRYTLTRDSLAIHDKFYPVTVAAASVDVENARVVDFDKDTDWKPVTRTDGFANAHYRSGWFRVASGKKVRMYRADSSRVVLLPPKGNGEAVLLETADPEKFVAELQREWGQGS